MLQICILIFFLKVPALSAQPREREAHGPRPVLEGSVFLRNTQVPLRRPTSDCLDGSRRGNEDQSGQVDSFWSECCWKWCRSKPCGASWVMHSRLNGFWKQTVHKCKADYHGVAQLQLLSAASTGVAAFITPLGGAE